MKFINHQIRLGVIFGLIQAIKESKDFSNRKFENAFNAYLEECPQLEQYIGGLIVGYGSGWSFELVRSFGLTIYGIEQVLAKNGMDVSVLQTEEQFKHFILKNQLGKAKAIISDEMYKSSRYGKHVYAISYQKIKGYHILHVYDPVNSELPIELLKKCFNGESFIVYFPASVRQRTGDASCYAYALHDLSVMDICLSPIPDLTQSYFGLSILSGIGFFKSVLGAISETRLFELGPEFYIPDINDYKKHLFKTVIDLASQNYQPKFK